MRPYDLIKKKRDGVKLTAAEIDALVEGYVKGTLPDYQMAAMLMAIYFKGMDAEETFWLTDAMRRSGDQVELKGIEGFTVDKHSTGGVGDKTSLVLGPILAALGLKVAKMSGRGLGHTGGTIDKLESIKGFTCELPVDKFIAVVNRIGVAIVGQTGNLVPADKKIYALRDVTATVDSIPLIAASIMSKKLTVPNNGLVLDVKVGSGAFMKTQADAKALAQAMVAIGKQSGRQCVAVLSNMDEPLGEMIGNALEVKEAIATLQGKGPRDLVDLVSTLAGEALRLSAGGKISAAEAKARVEKTISDGSAFQKLCEMVEAQGGDPELIRHPERLPAATKVEPLPSPRSGYITRIECEQVGIAAMMLGAGRETKDSIIDPAVGMKLVRHVGHKVAQGEPLAELHLDPKRDNRRAIEALTASFVIEDRESKPLPLVLDIVS